MTEWEINADFNFCNEHWCRHEFRDGDNVYVTAFNEPDGYPGGCEIYCKEHAKDYYSVYKAKITPPRLKTGPDPCPFCDKVTEDPFQRKWVTSSWLDMFGRGLPSFICPICKNEVGREKLENLEHTNPH